MNFLILVYCSLVVEDKKDVGCNFINNLFEKQGMCLIKVRNRRKYYFIVGGFSMSQLPLRKDTPDGYRPVTTPKAVKMINRGNLSDVNEQETIQPMIFSTTPVKAFTHMTYESVYSSDLRKSIEWYNKAFGFQIVTMNPDFSLVEILPGRQLGVNSLLGGPCKVGFVTKNMNALKRQLKDVNIKYETIEESQIRVTDPDGNLIDIRSNGYGTDHLNATVPHRLYRDLIRCRLETKDGMKLVARGISDDNDFKQAAEELTAGCQSEGISTEGDVFIVSECRHTGDSVPGQGRPIKVENLYACIRTTDACDGSLPEGMVHLEIPPHDYTVYSIDYSNSDILRTVVYEWRSNFMANSFTRPEGRYYILEQHKDDYIYISMPYYWNKGWKEEEIRRKAEEQKTVDQIEGDPVE